LEDSQSDLQQGMLELIILKTLALEPMHGWGIARRIQQRIAPGLRLLLIGVLVGLAGALVLTRFLRSLLFEISPTDPATFAAVAVLLCVVGFVASYLPARRATRIDPMSAVR
jgi:hypothetical protein